MKLLMLCREALPTHRVDVTALFGKYLPRFGVESDLIGLIDKKQTFAWPAGRIYGFAKPRQRIMRLLLGQINFLWSARCLFRERYDAIMVRDHVLTALWVLIFARIARLPFYYWMSFPTVEAYKEVAARRRGFGKLANLARFFLTHPVLYKCVLKNADHLFAQSDHMKRSLIEKGIHPNMITPVPMGVDVEAVSARHDATCFMEGDTVKLVYIGSIGRVGVLDMLLEMLSLLVQWGLPVRLTLVGEAGAAVRRSLEERTAALGLERSFTLTGWLPRLQAWEIARQSHIGLAPIPATKLFLQSSPTKTLEYMALGLPVVANRIPDQEKVIEESGAGLCVEFTAEAFANAVRRLMTDRAAREQCAAAGPRYIAEHRHYAVLAEFVAGRLRQLAQ